MDFKKKIFINKDLTDTEVKFIKSMLQDINIEEYLEKCFVYIDLAEEGSLEIISIADEHVIATSEELNINYKMAMQYIRNRTTIEQTLNMLLYWNEINDIKKYVPVKEDELHQKEYAPLNVYANSVPQAIKALSDMYYDDYTYLEDVDA
jgi:hypothetical protein